MPALRFGEFELNLQTGELRDANTSVRLPPQPAKVLELLVSRPRELVTREEIEREVWGEHTTVDFDRSLNSCIKQLRQALRDEAENPRYIETLPRRGYRFIAPVERTTAASPVVIQSVAVLPTRVLASSEDGFLADAIPNSLSTYLAHIEGLETKLPPTALEFERLGGDLDRLAAAYRVSAFVLPTLTVEAARYSLNLQLVEAQNRRLLWTDEFERERPDYLQLLREAGESLRAVIRPASVPVTAHVGASASSEAELAFQRGLYYSNRFNNLHQAQDFLNAAESFQRALGLDPALADAAAESAWLYEFKIESGAPAEEALAQLDTWVRRSLEIDPGNGRAWALITHLEANLGGTELRKMLAGGLRAASSSPRYARAHVSLWLPFMRGSCRMALAASREASRLEPLYLYPPTLASHAMACLGQTEEALRPLEEVLQIEPQMSMALMMKAERFSLLERPQPAAEAVKQVVPQLSTGRVHPAWLQWTQDLVLFAEGKRGSDQTVLERLVRGATGQTLPFPYWPDITRLVVPLLSRAGKVDESLYVLQQRIAGGIIPPYDYLMLNPDLAPLRARPAFQDVLAPSRSQLEEMLAVLEESRTRGEFPAYLEEPLSHLLHELNLAKE